MRVFVIYCHLFFPPLFSSFLRRPNLLNFGNLAAWLLMSLQEEVPKRKTKSKLAVVRGLIDGWQPWQGRGNYLKLLLYFCFHLVVSLWWLSETETGNVWIGSNGMVEWSQRNERHGRNTNLLSSLNQLAACRNQICQNCLRSAWFKAYNAVWMKSPFYWAVTQRRTVVCFRRLGTPCWSHFIGQIIQEEFQISCGQYLASFLDHLTYEDVISRMSRNVGIKQLFNAA